MLHPLIKALGQARKAFLSPLMRYWVKPCCENPLHLINYSSPAYLPALGSSVFRLRDNISDALYTRRGNNFRVICSNRLLGIGPNLSDEAAKELSRPWGGDPVHPLPEANEELASRIVSDILIEGVKYINPPKEHHSSSAPKKPRTDLACSRQGWVEGCSAILLRRDTERTGSGPVRTGRAGPHKNRDRCSVGNRARSSAGNHARGWHWRSAPGHGGRGGCRK
jgi:hypothetical protein